ncbi:MAG TPA: LexA family transcriptional regulator [Bacteroidales bacterium]|nr:LexA family transcriptional regulator [Bacteroidales bacterium]HRZ47804.1 LexA family transcriptional regulator [Bacteroidales bacterium]
MFFSNNIKFLRKRRGRTQDDAASALGMKRPTLSGYENNVAQPNMEALIAFSQYFGIAIDTLVKIDLQSLPESQLSQLERGYDVFITGSRLRVLATTVNSENIDNIELVHEKASAGYARGFADPEYIKVLPAFQLPFLPRDRKFRTFQISGDSMLPIPHGSFVTCEYVQNWNTIRSGMPYIIVTLDDGIMFKLVENMIPAEGKLRMISLNALYEPYTIEIGQVREVWRFVNYISSEIPEGNTLKDPVMSTLEQIKQDVKGIQAKLNL